MQFPEAVAQRCSVRKGALRNFVKFTGKHLRSEACNVIEEETLTQLFSCELCEITKNIFS